MGTMADARFVRLSKLMSLILRHRPGDFGVTLDAEGFTPLRELLRAVRTRDADVTEADLRVVVEKGDPAKQRFSIVGEDIRANYGHSLERKILHPVGEPPEVLFHGTAEPSVDAILSGGLRPMRRQYVHLTPDRELALRIGARHGKPCLLRVDAGRAHRDGIPFRRANESFWLVDSVPASYLRRA